MGMKKYWMFNFGDGSIDSVELTEEEYKIFMSEAYAIFETKEEAERFAKGE